MRYRENQRKKALAMRDSLFHDKGNGIFLGKEREFVLHDPTLNLWEGIREEALEYFKKHAIPWWQGRKSNPSGHLLSSQVACVNHLCFIRDKKDLATSILSAIDHEIVEAIIVDEGYLEFEFIGSKQYLMEKSWQRGANCTSVDAVMTGRNKSGQKKFFLIEWKYTEDYRIENKYIKQRAKVYDELIKDCLSPFKEIPVEAF